MQTEIISVSQFVGILNTVMIAAFPQVIIEGEISGWKVWQNRLVFFDLKDEGATLSCMVPLASVRVPVEDGMDVRISGAPRITDKGKFSFTVRSLELTGEGAIRRAYELLRLKLEREGLFTLERKRKLPLYPTKIGLITAAGSAAYADFMKILNARFGGINIEFIACQVQGNAAPDQLVGAVQQFNGAAVPVDIIVLVRGGGSLEDLQAFNDEAVVRAVAASRIPTVVGVGHEVDTSLADLVADVRAATPTDAAQRIVPDRHELMRTIDRQAIALSAQIAEHVRELSHLIAHHESRFDRYMALILSAISGFNQRYRAIADRLERTISTRHERLEWVHTQMSLSLTRRVVTTYDRIERIASRMSLDRQLTSTHIRLTHIKTVLELLNPQFVLGRGYSITRRNGLILMDASVLRTGDALMIELAQDNVESTVTEVHYGNQKK
jgi:exodeoxyribonuclease VII large subunit